MTERFINFPPGGGGGTGADPNGSYVVVSGSGAPASARTLVAGSGVVLIDGGPGSTLTLIATGVVGPAGPTGSTGAAGGADPGAAYLVVSNTASLANERSLVAGTGISLVDGGANSTLTVKLSGVGFADVSASYITLANTGSLPNERALAAGNGIAIDDGGAGNSVTIRATGVSFDASASYLVLGATASLANERVLTPGTLISFTDGGAGGALTINASTGSTWTPFLQLYTVTASYVIDSRPGVTDNTLMITANTHNITCSLPTASQGRAILFKDIIGSASNYPFKVAPTGGAKIDAVSASYDYNINFGTLKLFSDGNNWYTW